jgi:hypothetical protein
MEQPNPTPISFIADAAIALAAVIFFVAERIADSGTMRTVLLCATFALFCYSVARRGIDVLQNGKGRGAHARLSLGAYAGLFLGVLGFYWSGVESAEVSHTANMILIAALICGLSSLVVIGMLFAAAGPVRYVARFDAARIYSAAGRGLSVSMAIAALCLVNFAVVQTDWRHDLSYGGPSKPSPATRSIIEAADGEIEVFLFFAQGSPVLAEILDYFESLKGMGVKLVVTDHALNPSLSEELKVSRNGTIAFRVGDRSESWFLSDKKKNARRKLKKIDAEVRTRLSKTTRDKKTVYFTRGHGERPPKKVKKGERLGGSSVGKLLKSLNAKEKNLGVADGLGNQIPDDADLVVVFGPTKPFLDEEVATLIEWTKNEGALLLLTDPDVDHNLEKLYEALQLKSPSIEICNDKEYIKSSRTIADHAFIFSTSFTSHKAVKTLSSVRGKAAVFFLRSGHLARMAADPKAPSERYRITSLARTRGGSFQDVLPNRAFDAKQEARKVLDVALAVEGISKSGHGLRAVAVGDSDAFADGLLGNEANQLFAYESILWLLRDDQTEMGTPQLEEDVPIRHTRDQDVVWFYGTVFAVPCFLFGCAFLAMPSRRRRNRS